jgi:RNA polymerase sigma-70 factor (ECF subfamily)
LCAVNVLRSADLLCAGRLLRADVLLHSFRVLRPASQEERLRIAMTVQLSTEAIWTHLKSELRRFIRRRVSDDHAADDLLQEAFVRIHRNLGTLHDADRLAAWVYQIARNVIHDHYRQSAKDTVAIADEPMDDGNDRASSFSSRAGAWLDEMIRQLPGSYQEAVRWSELDGLPQQDVADRLGLSLSGAKSRIQRGRVMLKEALDNCCHFEFDQRGNLMGCDPRPGQTVCGNCDE